MIELVSFFYARRMMLWKLLFGINSMAFVFFLVSYPDFSASALRNGGNIGKLKNISSLYWSGLFILVWLWLPSTYGILRFDHIEKKSQAYQMDEFSKQIAQTAPILMFVAVSWATVALMAYIHVYA